MTDSGAVSERRLQRALQFRQCPQCGFDFATGEGVRACHYYACPYLPEELNVVCSACNYNFLTRDGVPGCGDPPTCSFSVEEAPARVEALRRWLERQPV